jgi:hypothetical protein
MIELNELTPEEQLTLIGLLKAVVGADRQLSLEEDQRLESVARAMGEQRFRERVSEAQRIFTTLADIKRHALLVERQPAREVIFKTLQQMSQQDGVIPEEEEVLTWLAERWEVELWLQWARYR